MLNKGMFSSNTDEWETPQDLFDKLNAEFNFTLDVAADYKNAKCPVWIDKDMDGLKVNWCGICWMNPPYGREIGKWVQKAYEQVDVCNARTVVCLLPARTDTRWFHDYIWNEKNNNPKSGVEVRLLKGRLKFGNSKNSAPFPSMIVIFT